MLYKAIVLDNTNLFTRGTIRVRVPNFYNKKMTWNLEEGFPSAIEEGEEATDGEFTKDFEAVLHSPLGGGRNYGVLQVPQINEKGIVAFLGGGLSKPVWMGSIFEPVRDDSFQMEYVNFPSDKFEDGEDSDGVNSESNIGDDVEKDLEKSIIIRTKHTTKDSASDIDFQQQKTSNIITIGKRRTRITNFQEEDWNGDSAENYSDIIIGLNDDGEDVIQIERKKEDKTITFKISSEGIFASIEEGDFNLITESGNFIVSSPDGDVEVEAKNVNITSEKTFVDGDAEITGKVKIAGGGDSVVLHGDLLDIIEKFENHIHVAPTGPTSPPLESNQAPLAPGIIGKKNSMKSKNLETD